MDDLPIHRNNTHDCILLRKDLRRLRKSQREISRENEGWGGNKDIQWERREIGSRREREKQEEKGIKGERRGDTMRV